MPQTLRDELVDAMYGAWSDGFAHRCVICPTPIGDQIDEILARHGLGPSAPAKTSPLGALLSIARIIEDVDQRCFSADGPVTPTLQKMRQAELSAIYALATSHGAPR